MDFLLPAVITLGAIAVIAALILALCAKKFAVQEDPRVTQVLEVLPQANCGGCGFPGCAGLADALVKGADAGSIEGISCPVGGAEVMSKVADLLGMAIANSEPKVAVVRCGGTCKLRPKIATYDGLRTCTAIHSTGSGETACGYGCVGGGDCERVCAFEAIKVNPETGLPEVDEEKCTSCGACVKACPRHIIELRNKGKKIKETHRRVWVACQSNDKGVVAKKACSNACIGCAKCQKACKFEAITIANNLCYIDFNKCKSCGLCVRECPTGAIKATFELPTPKPKPATEESKPVVPTEPKVEVEPIKKEA